MYENVRKKHFLTWRIFPFVVAAVVTKIVLITLGVELFQLNTYFSTLVAGNVFLLGFLISGVLPDYKEAEKLPAEIAASLDSIIDECRVLYVQKQVVAARMCIEQTGNVIDVLIQWFHEEVGTRTVMAALSQYADLFGALEPHTQANFITRLKQEVASIRRMVLRVRNIRAVPFAQPAYAIAELFTIVVVCSVVLVDVGTLAESVFITAAVTYILTYMIALINDLDNPFHYHGNTHLSDEIAIEPFGAVRQMVERACESAGEPTSALQKK